jgi:hypothetical protein
MSLKSENRHNAAYVDLMIYAVRFDTYYIANLGPPSRWFLRFRCVMPYLVELPRQRASLLMLS